jgi:hypothetical protein
MLSWFMLFVLASRRRKHDSSDNDSDWLPSKHHGDKESGLKSQATRLKRKQRNECGPRTQATLTKKGKHYTCSVIATLKFSFHLRQNTIIFFFNLTQLKPTDMRDQTAHVRWPHALIMTLNLCFHAVFTILVSRAGAEQHVSETTPYYLRTTIMSVKL